GGFEESLAGAEVGDEAIELSLSIVRFLDAQQGGRVDRHGERLTVRRRKNLTAHLADGQRFAGEAARSADAEGDKKFGFDDLAFEVEPPFATFDLVLIGTLVQTTLAARLELEVLHRVGDESVIAVDAGLSQRAVKHDACGSHKRMTSKVFFVAGL